MTRNRIFDYLMYEAKLKIFKKFPSRESNRDLLIHGKILMSTVQIICRISNYFLRVDKLIGFGKGALSRSEPLFCHPNPSFNSIGRAARENAISRSIISLPWQFESVKITFTDTLFLTKNKILKLCGNFKKCKLKILFKKLDSSFLWYFLILKKYRRLSCYLKSGIKYGGNFIIYYGNLTRSEHIHSKSVLILENDCVKDYGCLLCSFKYSSDCKHYQNKIRLAQQVSKKINVLKVFEKKKKSLLYLKKKWILVETTIERFVPK